MSAEDVIELGSSDDEKEPVPKKKKSLSNAMVRIPNPYAKLPGITIKPASKVTSKVQKSSIETKKILNFNMPHIIASNNKIHTKVVHRPPTLQKKLGLHCVPIKMSKPIRPNAPTDSTNTYVMQKVKGIVPGTELLNNLPPSITIKRANDAPLRSAPKKAKVVKQPRRVVQTVEIDDEIPETSSSVMPQWYKRPEEEEDRANTIEAEKCEEKMESIEEQNNKEPETKSYIEITIEDSPIKPVQSKKTVDVTNAITIEDSPVKAGMDKKDITDKSNLQEDKLSKKRLDYPHEVPIENNRMVEIEIDPIENNTQPKNNTKVSTENTTSNVDEAKTSKNSNINDNDNNKSSQANCLLHNGEFNEVYQKFIETCFKVENSDDMKKIVEKKIKAYYKQCPKEYVDSEEFKDFVSGKILAIESSPDKMYLYIKDVVDELNVQRKQIKTVEHKDIARTENIEYEIDRSEYHTKRQRQIRKLEKTLKKLHRAVQKLEEQEVDFDDEDDSVYLLTERYKERLVKVHAKFCQLTNTKMPSEPRIKLEPRPGRPLGPVRNVEKLINVKVPIGAPLPFPDFHDVLRCVRNANEEDKLGWSEMEIIEEARDIFTRCGKRLQRRRQENEWRIAASRIQVNEDPAEKDESLKNILEKNKQLATKKESEVFNKYADRQIQLKLEAEEIGDKEAEESPVESEEEDEGDNSNLLKDKEQRKMRLKRLLQENSKIISETEDIKSKNEESIKETEEKKLEEVPDKGNTDKLKEKEIESIIVRDTESKNNDANEARTISDDEINESEVDELHLLQKLYSKNGDDSSTSESESPISLSDTDDDGKDNKARVFSTADVISIENSSYSESENTNDDININNRNVENMHENNSKVDTNKKIDVIADEIYKSEKEKNPLDKNSMKVDESKRENVYYEINPSSIESIDSNENNKEENCSKLVVDPTNVQDLISLDTCTTENDTKENQDDTLDTQSQNTSNESNVVKKNKDQSKENIKHGLTDENNTKDINNYDPISNTQSEEILLSADSGRTNINLEENVDEDLEGTLEEPNENMLLGLSDDECQSDDKVKEKEPGVCVNLGDDNISISETCVGSIESNGKLSDDIDTGENFEEGDPPKIVDKDVIENIADT